MGSGSKSEEFNIIEENLDSESSASEEITENSPQIRGHRNKKQAAVNSDPAENESFSMLTTKDFALRSPRKLDLNNDDIKSFMAGMGIKGYSALANFHVACEYFNLQVEWGPKQVKAFLIFINYKYYAASYVA